MRVLLVKDARINHKAGDIVDVSPAEFNFLTSLHIALPLPEEAPAPKKTTKGKK